MKPLTAVAGLLTLGAAATYLGMQCAKQTSPPIVYAKRFKVHQEDIPQAPEAPLPSRMRYAQDVDVLPEKPDDVSFEDWVRTDQSLAYRLLPRDHVDRHLESLEQQYMGILREIQIDGGTTTVAKTKEYFPQQHQIWNAHPFIQTAVFRADDDATLEEILDAGNEEDLANHYEKAKVPFARATQWPIVQEHISDYRLFTHTTIFNHIGTDLYAYINQHLSPVETMSSFWDNVERYGEQSREGEDTTDTEFLIATDTANQYLIEQEGVFISMGRLGHTLSFLQEVSMQNAREIMEGGK